MFPIQFSLSTVSSPLQFLTPKMTTIEASSSPRPYIDGKPNRAAATSDSQGGIESVSVCRHQEKKKVYVVCTLYTLPSLF